MSSFIRNKSPTRSPRYNPSVKLNVSYFSTSGDKPRFEEEIKSGSLLFSSYWPKVVDKFFSSIKVDPSLFLLCPVYDDGSVQIGGTGTAKQNESLSEALIRESTEEFGCVPETLEGIEVIDGDKLWLMSSTEYFYNLTEVPELDSRHNDNKKRKVAFFYWADMERWMDIIFDMSMARKDNITGFVALSYPEVLRVVKILRV